MNRSSGAQDRHLGPGQGLGYPHSTMPGVLFALVATLLLPGAGGAEPTVLCEGVAPSQRIMPDQRVEVGGVALWRPEVTCHGQLLVLAVERAAGCPEPSILWREQRYASFAVSASQRHVLVPVPLETEPGEHTLHLDCGDRQMPIAIRVAKATYPSSALRVKKRYTREPPPRTAREREIIKEAFAVSDPERLWSGAFARPAPAAMTSPFGAERTYNNVMESQHRGLDIDGKPGDPIVATNDGVVVLAAKNFYYVGNAVFIDHGRSLFSVYFHMNHLDVKTGDRVTRGQRIGRIGATGRVTGPHLHFGLKLDGFYVDPDGVLAYRPEPVGVPEDGPAP